MSEVKDEVIDDAIVSKEEPVVVKLEEEALVVEKKEEAPSEPDEREQALVELKKQVEIERKNAERERQAREQAEQFAREQHSKVRTAEVEVQDSNLRTIINAIDAVEQTAKTAERAYADAMTSGDYDAAAKAQRAIARAESQLLQLNNGKNTLEERLQARTTEGRVTEDVPKFQPAADPIEEMVSRLTPKSAEWLRAHPDAAQNVNRLTAAHTAAVELEGIKVESPEYFAFIEQKMGMTKSEEKEVSKPPRKQPLPSAPTNSGSSSNSDRGGGSSMTLSPAEVEMAILNEPNLPRDKALEAYARNKAALIKEGKLK